MHNTCVQYIAFLEKAIVRWNRKSFVAMKFCLNGFNFSISTNPMYDRKWIDFGLFDKYCCKIS